MASTYARYNGISQVNTGVTSLNSLTGAVTLLAGSNVTLTPSGNNITIAATGGGGSGVDTIGTFDGNVAAANALSISGTTLFAQSASATNPGMVNISTQTFAGVKTFSSAPNLSSLSASLPLQLDGSKNVVAAAIDLSGTQATGILAAARFPALTGDITTSSGAIATTLATVNLNVGSFTNASITVNGKGLVTAASSGTTGNLTDTGTDGITVTGGTGAVLGSGTSIAQHVADTTHNGYLSSTDWNTFNGKQAAGNYITALTGDGAASGPGSVGLTLATVNSNVGSFGSSTSIPSFTVNGKGLITAASGNAVVAPASTLSGTTLASGVVTSSLTSVGTITSGIWTGTTIAIANGGTGQTSAGAAFNALAPATIKGGIIAGSGVNTYANLGVGTDTYVLTANSAATNGFDWQISASATTSPYELKNLGIAVTGSSNILTIALKQSDGSTNPSSGSAAVKVGMRSSTAATGGYNERSVTGSLSQTFTQGTAFGMVASQNNYLWLYLIDSDGAGTMKLGASPVRLDDGSLQTTIAESFTATYDHTTSTWSATAHGLANADAVQLTAGTSVPTGYSTATNYFVINTAANTFKLSTTPLGSAVTAATNDGTGTQKIHISSANLASDAVYSNVPVRLIGRAVFNLGTPGNWATPSEVSLPLDIKANEVIAAKYTISANFTSSATVPINFATVVNDTHGAVKTDASHWAFTAPISSFYTLSVGGEITSGVVAAIIYINGTSQNYRIADFTTSSGTIGMSAGTQIVFLNKNDVLDIRCVATVTDTNRTIFSISKIN